MAYKQKVKESNDDNTNCSRCDKFLDILKYNAESEMSLKCDECGDDNDPVVAFCVDCELCLCKICNDHHHKKHKTHKILSLDKASLISFCPEHPKYTIEHYCKTCEKFSCLFCAITYHTGGDHDNDIIEKMAYKHRKLLCDTIAPVEEMIESLSKAEDGINQTQEKIKRLANEIDREIDKCYYEQLQKLNEHHKQLKKRLHDAISWKVEALKKQLA